MNNPDFLRPATTRYKPRTTTAQAFTQHSDDRAAATRSGLGPPTHTHEQHTTNPPHPTTHSVQYTDGFAFDELDEIERQNTIVICAICDNTITRMYAYDDPTGEYTWIHSRTWTHHDHDPQPKTVISHATRVQCDFCPAADILRWTYEGNNIRRIGVGPLAETSDYGKRWAACDSCHPYIDNFDFEGLADRVTSFGPLSRRHKKRPDIGSNVRQELLTMWAAVFSHGYEKIYIGPPITPARLDPRHVDKYRRDLLTFWNHPDLYDRMIGHGRKANSVPGFCVADKHTDQLIATGQPSHPLTRDIFDRFRRHITTGITAITGEDGGQYWVSAPFTHIANLAANDLDTLLITREQLPAKFGFVVYETPIGDIERPDGLAGIRAFSWTLVPGGIWINIYFQTDDADPHATTNNTRAEWGTFMSPGTGLGFRFDHELHLGNTEQEQRTAEFMRTIFATWLLLTQPGVAEQTTAPVDKKAARKYQRTYGHKQPDVILVDLRRRPRRTTTSVTTENSKRGPLEYRRYTRGHWKRQFFGPKRGQRKLIYISPYIAGPEDAPLRSTTPTIKVLR